MEVATLKRTAKPLRSRFGNQHDFKSPLREGFTEEERKELQYAVSIVDYIREKGITI